MKNLLFLLLLPSFFFNLLFSVVNAQVFTSSNSQTNCVLLAVNQVKCWGSNRAGILGYGVQDDSRGELPGSMGAALPTVNANGEISEMCVGGQNVCVIRSIDSSLSCWGYAPLGLLGADYQNKSNVGDDPNEMGSNLLKIPLGDDVEPVQVFCATSTACVITTTGKTKCWGLAEFGAIGPATLSIVTHPNMGNQLPYLDLGQGRTVLKIAMAEYHTCFLLDGGQVRCIGDNHHGQLCQGHTKTIGKTQATMGDALPVINFGGLETGAIDVATGESFTLILRGDGTIVGCGKNEDGQLGVGDVEPRGSMPENSGDNLEIIKLGTDIKAKAITAGTGFACALTTEGAAKCWGSKFAGRLGTANGDQGALGDEPGEMGNQLSFADFGSPSIGATAIVAGFAHVCLTRGDSSVVCWGFGIHGALGRETIYNAGDFKSTMGAASLVPVNFGGPIRGGVVTPPTGSPTFPFQNCRLREDQARLSAEQCEKRIEKVEDDPECDNSSNTPLNIGYKNICVRPCGARALAQCNHRMRTKRKVETFDCLKSKAKDAMDLLRRLFKLECGKKKTPWFPSGGCVNSDGLGKHGCESLKCPALCVKIPSCAWAVVGEEIENDAVEKDFSNLSLVFQGECVVRS